MKMKEAKASKHNFPMEYRITWIGSNSAESSTSYYNVFHSSEALDFLAYTFRTKHIHTKAIKILAVEEWCRFSKNWIDRMEPAVKFCKAEELGNSILVPSQQSETELNG